MGFFMASDLYAEHYDSSDFLFGGNGLVTKDSLLKPAAFVFGFFDQMYPHILARSDHAIITTNRNGRYRFDISAFLLLFQLFLQLPLNGVGAAVGHGHMFIGIAQSSFHDLALLHQQFQLISSPFQPGRDRPHGDLQQF
jgi:hypothetical protein